MLKDLPKTLFMVVFVGIFTTVALAISLWLATLYRQHATAKVWQALPAKVLSWDLKSNDNMDSDHEKLVVTYQYELQGQSFTGSRLDFSIGADNFSGKRRKRQMQQLQAEQLTVYVNPEAPSEAVIDRSLPVEQVSFAVFFLFFPCGVGTAFLMGGLLWILQKGLKWETDRFYLPLFAVLHALPAIYPLFFAFQDLGFFSFLILTLFVLVGMYGLLELLWRLKNPLRGATSYKPLPKIKPLKRLL